MPIFEIETPDGLFEVDAPDQQSALSSLAKMQRSKQRPPRDLLASPGQNERQPRDLLAEQGRSAKTSRYGKPDTLGTTLTIEGQKVKVDDSFHSLSPERQNQTIDEIAASLDLPGTDGGAELTLDQKKALALARARRRIAQQGGDGSTMSSYQPDFLERAGNATFDFLKDVGLPVERMRRDNTNLDNAVRGAADTMSFGLADEIAAGANSAFGGDYGQELSNQRQIDEMGGGARLAGQVAGGIGGGMGLAQRGLSVAYNTAKAGKGFIPVAGSSAAEGAILSGAHGFGSGEGGFENRVDQGVQQGFYGSLYGLGTPIVARGAGAMGRKMFSPNRMSTSRQGFVNTLEREGIETTAGQKTGSEALRYRESTIGGKKAANIMETQKEQFTAAALRRAGMDAQRATPEVIDEGFRRIGKQFDDLAERNTLRLDQPFIDDISDAVQNYRIMVPANARVPAVEKYATEILQSSRTGLKGEAYQSARSRLDRAARSARKDPELSEVFRDIRDAMDNAMERSIAANNPADSNAWSAVRRQYRNMLVVEKAATGAGENAAQGLISPSHLRNATVQQGRRAYARGQGDFAELARAGEAIMKPLPQSGTAPRLSAAMGIGVPSSAGAAVGASLGGPVGAGVGAVAGMATPALTGKLMMSNAGQRYLTNQAVAKPMSDSRRALLEAMIRNSSLSAAGGSR